MLPIVWQARAGAALALAALGRSAEAAANWQAAEATVQEIAGLFQSQDLRQAYLEAMESRLQPAWVS